MGPRLVPNREWSGRSQDEAHRVLFRNEELCWSHRCGAEWKLLHPLSPDPLATALALETLVSLQQPVGCKAIQFYPLPVPTGYLPIRNTYLAPVLVLRVRAFETGETL